MGLTITHLVLGHNGILAAVSTSNKVKGLHYLTIWQRKSDDNIELKSRLEYNGKILGLNIDRSFITVAIVPATEDEENFKVVEFRFISAKTLVVGFCMKIDIDDIIVASGQGLLVFLNKNGSVR